MGPMARPSVAAPEELVPVPVVGQGRTLKVDPDVNDGKAHHPLSLFVQAEDVNGTPLVTTSSPTGYSPTTIKNYLGLTGTGSAQTIAIVVAYNAPNIATDLANFAGTQDVRVQVASSIDGANRGVIAVRIGN